VFGIQKDGHIVEQASFSLSLNVSLQAGYPAQHLPHERSFKRHTVVVGMKEVIQQHATHVFAAHSVRLVEEGVDGSRSNDSFILKSAGVCIISIKIHSMCIIQFPFRNSIA